jgi:hypothetical protein
MPGWPGAISGDVYVTVRATVGVVLCDCQGGIGWASRAQLVNRVPEGCSFDVVCSTLPLICALISQELIVFKS